jgi:hypothetical protein
MSKDDPRPRVVFDCMIFLQATASESGPAAALLRKPNNKFSTRAIAECLQEKRKRGKANAFDQSAY